MSCPAGWFICDPFGAVRGVLFALLVSVVPEPFPTLLITLLAVVLATTVAAVIVLSETLAERRIVGFMQGRIGPNRVGPAGLLQPIADGVKLLLKEIIIPFQADRIPFILAPLVTVVPSLMVWSVIPWGPGLSVTDLNIGVLFVVAMGSIPTIGILMAGWASGNKYALLGGMRVVAQLISYEIPMVLTILVPILLAGTMSLQGIVEAQSRIPFVGAFIVVFPVGTIAAVLFFIAGLAEVNRSPFDLPEAESEIIAGFHTEYSGMAWAMFYLAEYGNTFLVGAMFSLLFLGGWQGPVLPPWLWFFLKSYLMFFVIVWVRATLPRVRYDQMMRLAWKVALPTALVLVGLTALMVTFIPGLAGL
jgi:NADH-quinone oxidoreductase subunit H